MSLGPLLERTIAVDPSLVFTALVSTLLVFVCFTLSALYAPTPKYLHLGGFLSFVLLTGTYRNFGCGFAGTFAGRAFLVARIVLDRSLGRTRHQLSLHPLRHAAYHCITILSFILQEKRRRGDDDFVWHSVELFIDFIQVKQLLSSGKRRSSAISSFFSARRSVTNVVAIECLRYPEILLLRTFSQHPSLPH